MSKGSAVFEETSAFLKHNKPDSVSDEEVDLNCANHGRLCSLMDGIFSTLHLKRGDASTDAMNTLKSDLNLVRLKWKVK